MDLLIVYPLKWFGIIHNTNTDNMSEDEFLTFKHMRVRVINQFNDAVKTLVPAIYREDPSVEARCYGSQLLNRYDMMITIDYMGRMHYITEGDIDG